MNKREEYQALVSARKACHVCQRLTNPSQYSNDYDSLHVGPWSRWQGNLDARLMIVGQDWGSTAYFEETCGKDTDDNRTNKTLMALLASVGAPGDPPSTEVKVHREVFLTNAILCLKDGTMGAQVRRAWFDQCGCRFLKPTIEVVHPRIVVSLGNYALESMQRLFELPTMPIKEAVGQPEGWPLPNGSLFFAMYHCSPRVLYWHRKCEQQKADWQRVKRVLQSAQD